MLSDNLWSALTFGSLGVAILVLAWLLRHKPVLPPNDTVDPRRLWKAGHTLLFVGVALIVVAVSLLLDLPQD